MFNKFKPHFKLNKTLKKIKNLKKAKNYKSTLKLRDNISICRHNNSGKNDVNCVVRSLKTKTYKNVKNYENNYFF